MTKDRWLINLAILLGLVVGFSLAISIYISETFAQSSLSFLFPYQLVLWMVFLLPGALLYLRVLDSLSRQVSPLVLRARAVVLTPIVAAAPAILVLLFGGYGPYVWLFLLPGVLLYGLLVRLPERAG
jgi:hypothetical protein